MRAVAADDKQRPAAHEHHEGYVFSACDPSSQRTHVLALVTAPRAAPFMLGGRYDALSIRRAQASRRSMRLTLSVCLRVDSQLLSSSGNGGQGDVPSSEVQLSCLVVSGVWWDKNALI